MIAHLRGRLTSRGADRAVVECAGVGYAVRCSSATLEALPPVGGEAQVLVHTHFNAETGTELFGFGTEDERELFELLIAVQGVGPKVALAILSSAEPGALERAIAGGDAAMLRRIKGIGPKLADRLVVELRDKVVARAPAAGSPRVLVTSPSRPTGPAAEVAATLTGLGYRPAEAERAAARALERLPGADKEALLREALRAALDR